MEPVTITRKEYYYYSLLKEFYPHLFIRVRSLPDFIRKHHIPDDQLVHARIEMEQWVVSTRKNTKTDKGFIRAKYVHIHLIKDKKEEDYEDDESSEEESDEEGSEEEGSIESEEEESNDEEGSAESEEEESNDEEGSAESEEEESSEEASEVIAMSAPSKIPPRLILDEEEMFYGADGSVLEIAVVGERDATKCFFRVHDVGRAFGLKKLIDNITDKKSAYKKDKHFVSFDLGCAEDCPKFGRSNAKSGKGGQKSDRISVAPSRRDDSLARKDTHYFTYLGLMRAIFSSSSADAEPFLIWATKTLFTAHLGTKKQKQLLAATLTGISPDGIKNMAKTTSGIISCVYLFDLGTVKDLRKSMKIGKEHEDDEIVCKYGKTCDIGRRTREHLKTYAMDGGRMQLIYKGLVDVQHISKAEARISRKMTEMDLRIKYLKHTELIIASEKELRQIKRHFDAVTKKYQGRVKEIMDALIEKKNEIAMIRSETKSALLEKDKEILEKDKEILKRDNIILQMQLTEALRDQR